MEPLNVKLVMGKVAKNVKIVDGDSQNVKIVKEMVIQESVKTVKEKEQLVNVKLVKMEKESLSVWLVMEQEKDRKVKKLENVLTVRDYQTN